MCVCCGFTQFHFYYGHSHGRIWNPPLRSANPVAFCLPPTSAGWGHPALRPTKKGNVGRPALWPPCPLAPPCTIRAIAPHTPGTPRGTASQRKASLVKGRWTPQADGGIPTGYALCAVTPADGQESLRLAGSAPPFDKGGFSAPILNFTSNFTLAKSGKVCYNLIAYRFSGKYSRNPNQKRRVPPHVRTPVGNPCGFLW